jgi:hypothetical protein
MKILGYLRFTPDHSEQRVSLRRAQAEHAEGGAVWPRPPIV